MRNHVGMPLNQQNGKLLVKGSKLQADCACCATWYCPVGECKNAFSGGTTYKVNGQQVSFANQGSSWNLSEPHPSLGTVNTHGSVERIPLSACRFYLKISIHVEATVGGYKDVFWSPEFNADNYQLGQSVSDSVSDSNVQQRLQSNGSSVLGTYANDQPWRQAWASYGMPSFSVEMTFDEIVDARCVSVV